MQQASLKVVGWIPSGRLSIDLCTNCIYIPHSLAVGRVQKTGMEGMI